MTQIYSIEGSLLFNTIPQHSDVPVPPCHILQKAEVQMAFPEWLLKPQFDLYRDGVLTPMPRWNECTSVLGDYADNNNISVK